MDKRKKKSRSGDRRRNEDGAAAGSSGLSNDFSSTMEINEVEVLEGEVEHGSSEAPHMRALNDETVLYRKLNSDSVLVAVRVPNCLYFSGKCAVKVVRGKVDLYGYVMDSKDPKQYAFSPKGHSSLLCIKAIAETCEADEDLEIDEEMGEFLKTEELQSLPGALFVMQAFDNAWAEGLRNFSKRGESLIGPCPTGIGPGVLPIMKNFMDKLGFQFIPQSLYDKNRLMRDSIDWERVYSQLYQNPSRSPRVCVFGGKGVGKSTFNRWFANRTLSQSKHKGVLLIDLDPGQTEFTPAGVISAFYSTEPLLGPNFTHLRQAQKSIYIGGVNVADLPTTYLNAVVQLFEFVSGEECFLNCPWFINTMGFCQGLGVHLSVSVIKIFKPSCVIQLLIDNDRRSFPFDLNQGNVQKHKIGFLESCLAEEHKRTSSYMFLKITSLCEKEESSNANSWGRSGGTPRTLRDDMLISYFAPLIASTKDFSFKSIVPLNVSVTEVTLGTMNSALNFEGMIKAILGNLVALCGIPEECLVTANAQDSADSIRARFYNQCHLLPNTFYGYGVIRAYDAEAKILHVVTPADIVVLKENVNCIIVAGTIGLPTEFYTAGSGTNSETPYVLNLQGTQSRLNVAGKKYFAPKKVTHSVLKGSLL